LGGLLFRKKEKEGKKKVSKKERNKKEKRNPPRKNKFFELNPKNSGSSLWLQDLSVTGASEAHREVSSSYALFCLLYMGWLGESFK